MMKLKKLIPTTALVAASLMPNFTQAQSTIEDLETFTDDPVGLVNSVTSENELLHIENDSLRTKMAEMYENCGPLELSKINEVTAQLTYENGETEKVPLWTERRPWGRNTGILVDEGKRAMPLERNDVKSIEFSFPQNQLYNNGNGIKMFATALDSVERDISDLLKDYKLSESEMDSLKGHINFLFKATDYVCDTPAASLEGVVDLDKTMTTTVRDTVETFVDREIPGPERIVYKEAKKEDKKGFFTAGYQTGPNGADGVYLTLGADALFGSRLGGSLTIGTVGANLEEVARENSIEHLGENRVHNFKSKTLDENDQLLNIGAELGIQLAERAYLELGAGYFFGDQSTITEREIGIMDLDGNYIGDNNPIRDSQTEAKTDNSAYATLGLRMDLGKGWMIEGAYRKIGTESKGNGFSAGLGRRF